jgi:hypothetical protein
MPRTRRSKAARKLFVPPEDSEAPVLKKASPAHEQVDQEPKQTDQESSVPTPTSDSGTNERDANVVARTSTNAKHDSDRDDEISKLKLLLEQEKKKNEVLKQAQLDEDDNSFIDDDDDGDDDDDDNAEYVVQEEDGDDDDAMSEEEDDDDGGGRTSYDTDNGNRKRSAQITTPKTTKRAKKGPSASPSDGKALLTLLEKSVPKSAQEASSTSNSEGKNLLAMLGNAANLANTDEGEEGLVLEHSSFRKLRDILKRRAAPLFCSKANKKGVSTMARPIRFELVPKTRDDALSVSIFNSYCLHGTFTFEESDFVKTNKKKGENDYPESKCKEKEAHRKVDISSASRKNQMALVIANLFAAGQAPVFVQKGLLPFLLGQAPQSSVDLKMWTAAPEIRSLLPELKRVLLEATENQDASIQAYILARSSIAQFFLDVSGGSLSSEDIDKRMKTVFHGVKTYYKNTDVDKIHAVEFGQKILSLAHREFHFWAGDRMKPVGQRTIVGGPITGDD